MANENDVNINFKTSADLAAAEATAKATEKVEKTTEKAAAATSKSTKENQSAAKSLHEVKEGQESVKDIAEGLGQALEGNLTPAIINLTKGFKGLSSIGITGWLGVVSGLVTVGTAVWQAYQLSVEGAKKALEEADKAMAEGTATALASRTKGLKEANAELEKSTSLSGRLRQLESEASSATEQGQLAELRRQVDNGDISEFDAQRRAADISFNARSERQARQGMQLGDELRAGRAAVSGSEAAVSEAETILDRNLGGPNEAAAQRAVDAAKEELQVQRDKLAILEKQQEALAAQTAASKQQRDTEMSAANRAEREARGKATEENMKALGDEERKRQATMKAIGKRLADERRRDAEEEVEENKRNLEKQRKAGEDALKEAEQVMKEEGIDPKTGRHKGRSRPGAPNVSPGSGFDEAFKGEAKAAADSADVTAQTTKTLLSAQAAANNATASTIQQLINDFNTLKSQMDNLRTRGTTYQ